MSNTSLLHSNAWFTIGTFRAVLSFTIRLGTNSLRDGMVW